MLQYNTLILLIPLIGGRMEIKMKINRTKNASRNIIFGIIMKLYQMIIPFIMRTVMIYYMGVQYLGLNSLFTSVLQVLNLAELGVGNAMVYSMYKPIADDDTEKVCALMKLYRAYYRVIGGVIALVGISLIPFIPSLIKGDVPADINIYILYILNLSATVLSYWLFAYKNSIAHAHQRVDIINKISILTQTGQYILQFFVLVFLKNYYVYILVTLFTQVITNISTAIVVDKIYPQYKPKGNIGKQEIKKINGRIRDLFTSKIGMVIVNSADTIVISAFLGLTALAVYQNYYFILSSIIGLITVIFGSCTAGVGNSLIVETREKNFNDLNIFTFIILWISGFCSSCFLTLFQPFMVLWVGKEFLLPLSVVICLCAYFFIYELNQLLNLYKDAAGLWHKDRFRPLITALVNLGMNLLTVHSWGLYGVILSTVLSTLLVGMPWLIHNLFADLFPQCDMVRYLKWVVYYTFVSILACCITYFTASLIPFDGWEGFLAKLLNALIIPNLLFLIVYRKRTELEASIILVDKMTKGKMRLHSRFYL